MPICSVRIKAAWIALFLGAAPIFLEAQQINLSLLPTAVPDSFVVRATSTSDILGAVPNAVFTIRWEATAGGAMNMGDVQVSCEGYSLMSSNPNGPVIIGNYRYFTISLFGFRTLAQAGCPDHTRRHRSIGLPHS